VAYAFVAWSFLVLRKREPEMTRPYVVKHGIWVGWTALLLSLGVAALYFPGSPAALVWPYEWMIVFGWIILGVLLALFAKK
jgi:amino acid transporter